MNVFSSECSSGCESGWTSYLEHSFCSDGSIDKKSGFCDEHRQGHKGKEEVVGDEEDLSMVSDASSGPPHFYEDNGYFNGDNQHQFTLPKVAALSKNVGKRHKHKEHRRQTEDHQQLPSLLDDTASSPLINFSKKNFARTNAHASMEESAFHFPRGFSATHFQPSPSGNHLQGHQLSDFPLVLFCFLNYQLIASFNIDRWF
ncbi:hypothetical protein V6N12_044421 [Hibiscus sabdariffa]|uniref:Uncharacterized protein n=1 Tax=Hibiscus sabdariffa TaxID=183260 RepID=A0ABR2BMX8_9ROSI